MEKCGILRQKYLRTHGELEEMPYPNGEMSVIILEDIAYITSNTRLRGTSTTDQYI